METRKKKRTSPIVAFGVAALIGMQSIAHAGPGGSLKREVVIQGNEAQEISIQGGSSGGGGFLGIFGGGGKGIRDTETVVQGVNVVGAEIAGNISILDNKASVLITVSATWGDVSSLQMLYLFSFYGFMLQSITRWGGRHHDRGPKRQK